MHLNCIFRDQIKNRQILSPSPLLPLSLSNTIGNLDATQRRVSRRKKGSNRRKKAIQKLGKQHKKVADSRKNFHFALYQFELHRHDMFNVIYLAALNYSINLVGARSSTAF